MAQGVNAVAHQLLLNALVRMLSSYPTSLAEDVAALGAADAGRAPGGVGGVVRMQRLRAILLTRVSEKACRGTWEGESLSHS